MKAELEVIKLLMSAGADLFRTDDSNESPLINALGHFDVSAFKMLLDLQDEDVNTARNQFNGSLLHSAVCINGCPPVFVNFLLNSGIAVDSVDEFGDMPLHVAVQNKMCHPGVVDVLLKRGSPTITQNRYGETPLELAMKHCNPDTVQLLLKYILIEQPDFNVMDLVRGHPLQELILGFENCCKLELERMNLEKAGNGLTLIQFLQAYTGNQMGKNRTNGFNFDLLLQIVTDKLYPLYADVISSKFEHSLLQDKLEDCYIHAVVYDSSDLRCLTREVALNYDCARVLSKYVDEDVLLNMIIAFQ